MNNAEYADASYGVRLHNRDCGAWHNIGIVLKLPLHITSSANRNAPFRNYHPVVK